MQTCAHSFSRMNATNGILLSVHPLPRLVTAGPAAPAQPATIRWPALEPLRATGLHRGILAVLVATAVVGVGVSMTRTSNGPGWSAFPALRDAFQTTRLSPTPRVVPVPAPARGVGAATASGQNRTTRTVVNFPEPAILALTPRGSPEPVREVVSAAFFGVHSWGPPPPPPVVAAPRPPPKPTAPPLPFTYLGKMLDGGVWEAYLARGDETFVVREHAAVDANYRVETIAPPTMTIIYLPLKQTQTLSIGDL